VSILKKSACATLMGAVALGGVAVVPAAGQIGAIAAAAAVSGGAASDSEYALSGAPVFAESGLILTEGWSANAFGIATTTTLPFVNTLGQSDELEFNLSSFTVGAFAAVGERAMVGAVFAPVVSGEVVRLSDNQSNSLSGLGDLTLLGRLSVTESADGATRVAASASVTLATGDDGISSGATVGGLGVGVSHQLDPKTSVHGGGSVSFIGAPDGGESASGVGFSGAVVRQVSPSGWISGELLGAAGGGEWELILAPAGRIRANDKIFIDLGLAFGLATSDGGQPLDVGFAAGITYVPPRS